MLKVMLYPGSLKSVLCLWRTSFPAQYGGGSAMYYGAKRSVALLRFGSFQQDWCGWTFLRGSQGSSQDRKLPRLHPSIVQRCAVAACLPATHRIAVVGVELCAPPHCEGTADRFGQGVTGSLATNHLHAFRQGLC